MNVSSGVTTFVKSYGPDEVWPSYLWKCIKCGEEVWSSKDLDFSYCPYCGRSIDKIDDSGSKEYESRRESRVYSQYLSTRKLEESFDDWIDNHYFLKPVFEDGEPVDIFDSFSVDGKEDKVIGLDFVHDGVHIDGVDYHVFLEPGEKLKLSDAPKTQGELNTILKDFIFSVIEPGESRNAAIEKMSKILEWQRNLDGVEE